MLSSLQGFDFPSFSVPPLRARGEGGIPPTPPPPSSSDSLWDIVLRSPFQCNLEPFWVPKATPNGSQNRSNSIRKLCSNNDPKNHQESTSKCMVFRPSQCARNVINNARIWYFACFKKSPKHVLEKARKSSQNWCKIEEIWVLKSMRKNMLKKVRKNCPKCRFWAPKGVPLGESLLENRLLGRPQGVLKRFFHPYYICKGSLWVLDNWFFAFLVPTLAILGAHFKRICEECLRFEWKKCDSCPLQVTHKNVC